MIKQFKPSLIASILTLLAFLMLLKLGFWQLHRANEKLAVEQAYANRPSESVLTGQNLKNISLDNIAFRRVKLSGFFDNQHQFLLDNQHLDHRIGFRVLTPFTEANTGLFLLIDRGFIPRSNNMNTTTTLKSSSGLQTIEALVEAPIKKNFVLGNIQQTQNWPMVIEAIDFSFIQKQLHQRLYPLVLQLDAANKNSFEQSKQVVQVSHQRHIAYAIQWFLLAGALLIIFVIASFKKVKHQ